MTMRPTISLAFTAAASIARQEAIAIAAGKAAADDASAAAIQSAANLAIARVLAGNMTKREFRGACHESVRHLEKAAAARRCQIAEVGSKYMGSKGHPIGDYLRSAEATIDGARAMVLAVWRGKVAKECGADAAFSYNNLLKAYGILRSGKSDGSTLERLLKRLASEDAVATFEDEVSVLEAIASAAADVAAAIRAAQAAAIAAAIEDAGDVAADVAAADAAADAAA